MRSDHSTFYLTCRLCQHGQSTLPSTTQTWSKSIRYARLSEDPTLSLMADAYMGLRGLPTLPVRVEVLGDLPDNFARTNSTKDNLEAKATAHVQVDHLPPYEGDESNAQGDHLLPIFTTSSAR